MEYLKNKVIPVLVIKDLAGLEERIQKLLSDGYNCLEVTLRTDCAIEAIKIIKDKFPSIIVGAGTVLTSQQLEACIAAGADFGVAPGLNERIVKEAQSRGFDFIPGIATPSELELAISLGIYFVKVFPARILGGVDFIKALSAPYHMIKFMPTGGVSEMDYKNYLAIPSVLCVGGTWMCN
jgi:2-dehydro-3-deoxyphosphogluconate aldolase/(4S)-4-hydroxy-2-oxoglutarate aldolase